MSQYGQQAEVYSSSYQPLVDYANNYCGSCQRYFQNANNLQQHLNSRLHRPANTECPFCTRKLMTWSHVGLHLESGACPSGMTREKLNRLVVRADTNHYITNPNQLIGWEGSEDNTTSTITVTSHAYNQAIDAWVCYLCHREFQKKTSLEQHLNSSVHKAKIYRCPKSDCAKQFRDLSAILQHVESGSCGVLRFRETQEFLQRLNSGIRTIGYR